MTKEVSFGVRRLRQAIANQATCGSGQFELSIDSADRLCREIEDELARFAWAEDVPAPMDADGRLVPLSTETLYTNDGERVTVEEVIFSGTWWYVRCSDTSRLRLLRLHLAQPDSWERLEEDVKKNPCKYFGMPDKGCDVCPGKDSGCLDAYACDILRRAKAIAERDWQGQHAHVM